MRFIILTSCVLIPLLWISVSPSFAEDSAAARIFCDPKAGTLQIRYTPDLGQEKPAWPETPPPVYFMKLLLLEPDRSIVRDTKSETFTCKLPSGRFEITLEPGVPNVNLLGRCGGAVTGIVTVKRNGTVVLKEQEFEIMNCHEREKYIKSITFKDGSSKPVLIYGTYPD